MANTQYTPVTVSSGQLLDEDTLQQYATNIQFLKEQSVDGVYQHMSGIVTSTGVKLLCGIYLINPQKVSNISFTVPFVRFFSTTCAPSITTSITSTGQNNFNTTIRGIGQIHPNSRGFIANVQTQTVAKTTTKISKVYMNWIAMGY